MRVVKIPAWVTQTNGYLVFRESEKVGVLVDAPPDPEPILDAVEKTGVTIGAILLSHGHVDHTGSAGELERRFSAQVHVHPDDDFLTLEPRRQLKALFAMPPPGTYDVPTVFTALSDGDVTKICGIEFETRHTPGHTPGHCCFLVRDEGTLFSGDQLFAGSVGRTDLPGGSTEQLLESMSKKVLDLDDDVRVLPGHGPETTIGTERRTNPFLQNL